MNDMNQFILDIFQNRYTCKGYDPDKKVSDKDFQTIMEVARLSPSSFGYEPWKFILLNKKEIREKIRPYAWGAVASLDGASHFVLILAKKDIKYDSAYVKYIVEDVQDFPEDMVKKRLEVFENFQKNDFKLLDEEDALYNWALRQTYIPLANMLTSAAILGIDSTPIEGFDREKVENVLIEEGVYDPDKFGLSAMIAFGYTDRDHRPKTRRELKEVWEVIN